MPSNTPHALTPRIALLLTLAPLMWAANAVVGRMAVGSIPPVAMNLARWVIAFALLLPLAGAVLRQREAIAQRWRYLSLLGLLGMGCYNALQYMALHTSTPLNVTLIAASSPIWMLSIGAVFYGVRPRPADLIGAALSMLGVVLVIARGKPSNLLSLQFVPGDLLMLLAIFTWCLYSWQLARPPAHMQGEQRPAWDWAAFLMVQMVFGLGWSALATGIEASVSPEQWHWSWQVGAILLFVAVGPSLIAYRSWGMGVAAVGPAIAGFFGNLTPVFAGIFSAALLGQWPQWFHLTAFGLIVLGIVVSAKR